jgi:hypothetical protein
MAYSYTPKIRLTPPAGATVTYDLSSWSYTIRQEMRDAAVISEKEMLDFSVDQVRYGTRRQVFLEFDFPVGSTSNETDLIEIIRRSLSDEWMVEVSLDGGTTYRESLLSGYEVEDMEGKKIGRVYRTAWTVKALMEQPAAVLGGSW